MSGPATRSGASASVTSNGSAYRAAFMGACFVFLLATLFDPADRLFGLKIPLYGLCWCLGLMLCLSRPGWTRLPLGLVLYVTAMITIPLISIARYYALDASQPFEGFPLFKAYLFISMAPLLYVTRTDLMPQLSAALTALSLAVITVGTIVLLQPALYLPIYAFGMQYGIFSIDSRDYGSGLVLFQMYFVTSPMLALSAAYFLDRAAASRERRGVHLLLGAVNTGAMVFAGSRNNLLAAVLLPLGVLLLHSRRRALIGSVAGSLVAVGLAVAAPQLRILLDPAEASNRTKLAMLDDYARILGDPVTMLVGRGLGAYESWTNRGFYFVTELTYLEVLRNFGLLLGGVMIALLLFPAVYAFVLRSRYRDRGVMLGYLVYLVMCVSNPNLFSSMGMLILSVTTANLFLHRQGQALFHGEPS